MRRKRTDPTDTPAYRLASMRYMLGEPLTDADRAALKVGRTPNGYRLPASIDPSLPR